MIALRDESEIAVLREANRIVSDTLVTLVGHIRPGITTRALDELAEQCIRDAGAAPSFLGYRGYPNSTCISVEDVIVHGIPGERVLREDCSNSVKAVTAHSSKNPCRAYSAYVSSATASIRPAPPKKY